MNKRNYAHVTLDRNGRTLRAVYSDGSTVQRTHEHFPSCVRDKAIRDTLAYRALVDNPEKWASDWEYVSAGQYYEATGIDIETLYAQIRARRKGEKPEAKAAPKYSQEEIAADPVLAAHLETVDFIHKKSLGLRPSELKIADLKWKVLVYEAKNNSNIMMTGPAGCGKTMSANCVAKALDRPFFYFNCGAMQDARSALIGNLHFDQAKGTYLSESDFIKAIQTEDAVIMLDELSRSTHDAWNILMTVLDPAQRYVRIDESTGGGQARIVNVAPTVAFVATANIGVQYTATRQIDKAILDRFKVIEMDVLDADQELELLKKRFPRVDEYWLRATAEIAHATRIEAKKGDGKIDDIVSTRMVQEIAKMLDSGFTLEEAAEFCIYPFFDADGGGSSERVFVTQLVQKYKKQEAVADEVEEVDDSGDEIPF